MKEVIRVTLETWRELQRAIDWLSPISETSDGERHVFGEHGEEYLIPADVWREMLRAVLGAPLLSAGKDARPIGGRLA
jgi:hypothetical protein